MQSIIEALREVVGQPNFYRQMIGSNYTWDYGLMIEYFIACLILLVVVSFVFKLILKWFK